MKRAIKTASAILLALAMTTPAFAAPTDTDTTTDTPIATPTAAPSTSTRFTDINSEEFAWAKSYINDMAGVSRTTLSNVINGNAKRVSQAYGMYSLQDSRHVRYRHSRPLFCSLSTYCVMISRASPWWRYSGRTSRPRSIMFLPSGL